MLEDRRASDRGGERRRIGADLHPSAENWIATRTRIRLGPAGSVYHVSPARRVSPNQRPQDRDRCNDLGSKLGGTKEPERKGRLSDLWDIRHRMSNVGATR